MTFETHEFANKIQKMMDDIVKTEIELREKALLKDIDENDFIVGDMVAKHILESILPNNANVIYSPHANPNMVYMIKKMEFPKFAYGEVEKI